MLMEKADAVSMQGMVSACDTAISDANTMIDHTVNYSVDIHSSNANPTVNPFPKLACKYIIYRIQS